MLCLPCDTVKDNYRKSMVLCLIVVFGCASVYMISKFLTETVIRDFVDGLRIIPILLTLSLCSVLSTVFFILKNHYLREKIKTHQKLAQDLCHQRDFDMLSGLENRNSFIRFAQEVEKCGDSVSIMVCDIDGLKIINDTLGHMAGDKIIQKTAEILNVACPSNAHIFRIGGDEYIIIIQEVLAEQELMKLRQSIKKMIINYNADQSSIPLSLSIGFATSTVSLGKFWEVSKQADYNMYKEKRSCQEKVYYNIRKALIE